MMTMREAIKAHEAQGKYFFSPSSMAFFGSRVESELLEGNQFITSEQDDHGIIWNGERRYTIRQFSDDFAEIETLGEFGGYPTLESALADI